MTGPEGGGNQSLVAQMCLGAAMGVNTMSATLGKHEPMRVLMLDVENDKTQIRDNARKIYLTLAEMQPKVRPDIEWFDQTRYRPERPHQQPVAHPHSQGEAA